jgi:hypothetical protein
MMKTIDLSYKNLEILDDKLFENIEITTLICFHNKISTLCLPNTPNLILS